MIDRPEDSQPATGHQVPGSGSHEEPAEELLVRNAEAVRETSDAVRATGTRIRENAEDARALVETVRAAHARACRMADVVCADHRVAR